METTAAVYVNGPLAAEVPIAIQTSVSPVILAGAVGNLVYNVSDVADETEHPETADTDKIVVVGTVGYFTVILDESLRFTLTS